MKFLIAKEEDKPNFYIYDFFYTPFFLVFSSGL